MEGGRREGLSPYISFLYLRKVRKWAFCCAQGRGGVGRQPHACGWVQACDPSKQAKALNEAKVYFSYGGL